MLHILFSYWTVGAAILLFLGSGLTLFWGRKRLPRPARAALWAALAMAALYLGFILAAALAAGSNPPREPVPLPAA